jgi:hypothetical protein
MTEKEMLQGLKLELQDLVYKLNKVLEEDTDITKDVITLIEDIHATKEDIVYYQLKDDTGL